MFNQLRKSGSIFVALLLITVATTNITFAKDRYKDLFTNVNKADKYRYYSSPQGSAYVDKMPEGYIQVNTVVEQTLDTSGLSTGQQAVFKTTEPLQLADFLVLPAGSLIKGKVAHFSPKRKLVKNASFYVTFNEIKAPNGYTFELSDDTFEVMDLHVKKGMRYSGLVEEWYSGWFSGAKYPVTRALGTPIGLAIFSGGGIIGGAAYGAIMGDDGAVLKYTGLGFLRTTGGKIILNIVLHNEDFSMKEGTPIILCVDKRNVENLRYLPQYINIQNLLVASSLSDDKTLDNKIIEVSNVNNINSAQAIDYYERNVVANADDLDAQVNLGRTYISSGRVQKAIQYFNKLLTTTKDDYRIYYYLGEALEEAGSLSDAEKNYKTAISLNPNAKEIYLKLATLLKKTGNSTEAAEYFDKYNSLVLAVN